MSEMDNILEQVRQFADQAHGDQQRKYTAERYIAHPVRVMEMCTKYSSRLPVWAAALLHDVLEDTAIDRHQLLAFLESIMNVRDARHTISLVIELTDIYTKDAYPELNRRRRKEKEAARLETVSAEAQTIKYADIIDNCRSISEQDADFAPIFLSECRRILNVMKKGNEELYQQALNVVEREWSQLQGSGSN